MQAQLGEKEKKEEKVCKESVSGDAAKESDGRDAWVCPAPGIRAERGTGFSSIRAF